MAVLECPFCFEILEVEQPDQLHTAFSTSRPISKSYHGTIVKKRYKCQNPSCQKTITIFWYAPLEYLNRIEKSGNWDKNQYPTQGKIVD